MTEVKEILRQTLFPCHHFGKAQTLRMPKGHEQKREHAGIKLRNKGRTPTMPLNRTILLFVGLIPHNLLIVTL